MENIAGEVDVLAFPRGAIELDERHLDFGVAGDNTHLIRTGAIVRNKEIVDEANAGIEKSLVARGAIVGDGSLKQMADAIELVPGGLGWILHAQRLPVFDVVGVQIAARLLDRNHIADHRIGSRPEFWLLAGLERKRSAFQPLVDIGIRVNGALLRRGGFAGEAEKVVHSPVRDQLDVH